MAKRARGSVRPGQRRPIDRRPASGGAATPAARPAGTASTTAKPTGLSDAEVARAAELEAQLVAEERAAQQSRSRTRERAATRELVSSGPSGSLANASAEYAYVGRDVKDIVRIATLLIGILLALWIVIDVAKLIPIGG
jgi:inosine-uridine nucleoside N-ribohydrolase